MVPRGLISGWEGSREAHGPRTLWSSLAVVELSELGTLGSFGEPASSSPLWPAGTSFPVSLLCTPEVGPLGPFRPPLLLRQAAGVAGEPQNSGGGKRTGEDNGKRRWLGLPSHFKRFRSKMRFFLKKIHHASPSHFT